MEQILPANGILSLNSQKKMIINKLNSFKKNYKVKIPENNFLYFIEPQKPKIDGYEINTSKILEDPISSEPLSKQIKAGMKIAVLVDDLTRPTPQKKLLTLVLEELNKIRVKDNDITVIIALGTHRYMEENEIIKRFGKRIYNKVNIINHEWKDKNTFVKLGYTNNKTPIIINKRVSEADFIIGIGTIAPHDLAGWSGGCKIIQPGICSWETTQATHLLASRGDIIGNLGNVENDVRKEIENVGKKVGLNFILNVVLDRKNNIVKAICGDPIKAHREGVKYARPIYERDIPGLADIVITNAYPADIDYWQGIKPLLLAQKGIKENGTIILLGDFPEGISLTHPYLKEYGNKTYEDIKKLYDNGKIKDGTCAAALMIHTSCIKRTSIICVSDGLSKEDKSSLNFIDADIIEEALKIAFSQHGKSAKIGIIEYGGDVIPVLNSKKGN